jgi:uncharacterized protein YdhG (YjbR/CyaY superfamily)
MPADEVDRFLEVLPEAHRNTLEDLRSTLLAVLPDAEEGLAYGVPAYRVRGKLVAGFAAHAQHLNYLPHSGTVVATLGDELRGYATTKGSVKFRPGEALPEALVRSLVAARLDELGLGDRS